MTPDGEFVDPYADAVSAVLNLDLPDEVTDQLLADL